MAGTRYSSALLKKRVRQRVGAKRAYLECGDGSAANDNYPYRLMPLTDVHVACGVMHRGELATFESLVVGDHWSFQAGQNAARADTLDEGCCVSVHLASKVDIGSRSFVIGATRDLVLMSDKGTVLECRHVTNRDQGSTGYLLLPAVFDASQTYELIAKNHQACR